MFEINQGSQTVFFMQLSDILYLFQKSINQVNQIYYIQMNNRLDHEPFMKNLQQIMKPAYYGEVKQAIEEDDKDKIWELLEKYLRKREVNQYYSKIITSLNDNPITKNPLEQSWAGKTITSYLKKRLDNVQYAQFQKVIKIYDIDLCRSFLYEYLRYDQAKEVIPHVQIFIQQSQNSRTKNYNDCQNVYNPQANKSVDSTKKQLQNHPKSKPMHFDNSLPQEVQTSLKQLKSVIDTKQYAQLINFLEKGKFTRPIAILYQFFGKKQAEKYLLLLKKYIAQSKNKIIQNSKLIKTGKDGMKFYKLNAQPNLHPYVIDGQNDQAINVLIVGRSGVGKSTYLNAIANYFMLVDMQDNFRYILNEDCIKDNADGKSATQDVHIYELHSSLHNKKVRLIDVPGLGDTGGIKKDSQNIQLIRLRIENEISYLHLVIYIFKASETRLSVQSKFVMGQIMGMFAKDVAPNILFLLTFADNKQPNIIPTLKYDYSEIISAVEKQYGTQWFIKINNSALFRKIDEKDTMDVAFYNMGIQCLKKTVDRMLMSKRVDTANSQKVLKNRKQLKEIIVGFHDYIKHNMEKQQDIRKTIMTITVNGEEIKGSSKYEISVQKQKVQIQKTTNNVTSCLNCKFTCHSNCRYKNNQDKKYCIAMNQRYFCKICPQQCSYTAHINDYQIIKKIMVTQKQTFKQLLNRYQIASSSKQKNQELLVKLVEEYCANLITIQDSCKRLRNLNKELEELELKKINYATVIEYIDMMIDLQKHDKKSGYKDRVIEYQTLKDHEIRKEKLLNDGEQDSMKAFKEIMESKIKELIRNKQLAEKILNKFTEAYKRYQDNILPEQFKKQAVKNYKK